ncbi:MAG: prepilin peptidase [Polyangiaceae bacterium]|nr:prepilin peptidase [Polyangiaceae bacterium]
MAAPIPLPVTLAAVATLIAAVSELRTRQVPNVVTLPLLFVGMAVTVWERNFYAQLIGLVIVTVWVIPAFSRGWISGGVTKLMLGVGLCVGAWMAGYFTGVFIVLAALFFLAARIPWVSARIRKEGPSLPGAPICLLALLGAYGISLLVPR